MTALAQRVHTQASNDRRRNTVIVAAIVTLGLLAMTTAGLAMRVARQADQRSISTAQHQLLESQASLVRSQVAGCESRVRSREDTRVVLITLLDLTAENPNSAAATAIRSYIVEAYDPINCTYGAADFGIDTDPPSPPTITPAVAPAERD